MLALMSATPLDQGEADRLLAPLARYPQYALAVSGGPDSLALMSLSADFARRQGALAPVVLTVDHGLRAGSRAEAETGGSTSPCRTLSSTVVSGRTSR